MIQSPQLGVELLSPEDSVRIIEQLEKEKRRGGNPRQINLSGGICLKGSADIYCRDAATGELAWEQHVDNVITDYGRREWFGNGFRNFQLMACGNTQEQPDFRRFGLSGPADSNSNPAAAAANPTYTSGTQTKSWNTSFVTPSSNRTIGTVALGFYNTNSGLWALSAYLLLSPAKTQTTSQTLELVYKVTLTAIT
jgi:hypothetical protein